MKRTISVITEDRPGVLVRLAGLIYRRNYNIDSLSVGRTNEPGLARFTIVLDAEGPFLEQVMSQLKKLVEVIEVKEIGKGSFVERWLSLIKVKAPLEVRPHILQIVDVFRCRVVDIGSDALIVEVTGDRGKMEACIEALSDYGILEIASSGAVGMERTGFSEREEGPVRYEEAS